MIAAAAIGGGRAHAATRGRLTLTVTFDRGDYVFDQADAVDVGTYEGEHVRQRCFRATHPDLPEFTVFFRPDEDNSRAEIVVEYGRSFAGDGTHVAAPYRAIIRAGTATVATLTVPHHWRHARWRWQSAPRPVVRTVGRLRDRGWILPFGTSGLYGAPSPPPRSYAGPMDNAGLDVAMGSGGDIYDIGPVTEWQADYLINGTASSLATLLAQGEACASMPFHYRDQTSGAAVDVQRHPGVGFKASGGAPAIVAGEPPKLADGRPHPRYFALAASHMPAAAYVPYVLTDDPYFLEELEAQATHAMVYNLYHRHRNGLPGLVYPGQTRAFAWSLRHLFQLGALAPASPPSWLKPRAYWQRCVDDNLTYMRRFMEAPVRIHSVFRAFPRSDVIAEWQNNFLATVIAQGILLGFAEWRDAFDWYVDATIRKVDGKSGWNRQWPAPYYYSVIRENRQKYDWATLATPTTGYPDVDADTCHDWAEAWRLFKASHRDAASGHPSPIDDSRWDGKSLMQDNSNVGFYMYQRAVLALAARMKIPGAREGYKFLVDALPKAIHARGRPTMMRWSIDPP